MHRSFAHMAFLLLAVFSTVLATALPLRAETPPELWSIRASASRSAAGAVASAVRLRAAGFPDAGVLMLYDDANTLWYVVETATATSRQDARPLADQCRDIAGAPCLVRRMDRTLHEARRISNEGLRNSALIIPPPLPDSTPPAPVPAAPDGTIARPVPAAPQSVAPAEPPAINEQAPPVFLSPFAADTRQAETLLARSLFRRGDFETARSMFQFLLQKYGPEEELRAGYIETLIASARWAEADAALAEWREEEPDSLAALRQTAQLQLAMAEETGLYEASYPWLEAILEQAPDDTGVRIDYAYARLNAGDWHGALALFSDVYDADPENESAAGAIQGILRERGPQLRVDYRSEVQAGDVSINTLNMAYSGQIDSRLRLDLSHARTRMDRRSDEDGTRSIARELLSTRAGLQFEPDGQWLLGAGLAFHDGSDTGLTPDITVVRRFHGGTSLRFDAEYGAPWTSTLDAANLEGTTDTFMLSLEHPLDENWFMSAGAGLQRYSVAALSGFALQEREEFTLGRRIHFLPDVTASYSFTRTRQNYRQSNPGERPVDLVDKEDIHALRVEKLHWYNEYIALRSFASAGYDVFRLSPLLSVGGGLRIRLGQRLDLDLGAEYNNDTGQAGGGESKAITTSIIYHF